MMLIVVFCLILSTIGATNTLRHRRVHRKRVVEGEECVLQSEIVNTCAGAERVKACDEDEVKFEVLMLGVKGGVSEENLSAYAVRKKGHPNKYVLLDGGSVHAGLRAARLKNNFGRDEPRDDESAEDLQKFWKSDLKAVLIGHSHLDHLSGFLIAMTEAFMGRSHSIYGLPWILKHLKSSMFNDILWPKALLYSTSNPSQGIQGWVDVEANAETDLTGSGMKVTAMKICHGHPATVEGEETKACFPSTSYLLKTEENDASLLYLSDVGPFTPFRVRIKSNEGDVNKCVPNYVSLSKIADTPVPNDCGDVGACAEHCKLEEAQTSDNFMLAEATSKFDDLVLNGVLDKFRETMFNLWRATADEVCADRLRAVFMECAYPDRELKPTVFGHLQPVMYFDEIRMLGEMVRAKCPEREQPLKGLTFVITHIKPYHDANYKKYKEVKGGKATVEELTEYQFNDLYDQHCAAEDSVCHGVKFLIPEQGTVVSM